MNDKRRNAGPAKKKGTPEELAVIVSRADGVVVEMNHRARELFGDDRIGEHDWHVVGGAPNSRGLPCDDGCVCRLVAEGADGAMAKDVVLDGERVQLRCVPFDGHVVTTIGPRATSSARGDAPALTGRELDVLRLLAEGLNTSGIAARLQISAATVRTHVEHMRDKLRAHTRAALVAQAVASGLLDE